MDRIFLRVIAGILCAGCSYNGSETCDAEGSDEKARKQSMTEPKPVVATITSLDDAVRMLGAVNELDIELRDERKTAAPSIRPTAIQFHGNQFWSDLNTIERLFDVRFQWLGQPEGSRTVVLRLSDEPIEIKVAYAEERFRIIVHSRPKAFLLGGGEKRGATADVTLNWLPGDRVLGARWRPKRRQGVRVLDGVPHWGSMYLGIMSLEDGDELSGKVEIVVGITWEQVTLSLSAGSKVALRAGGPITSLEVLQMGGTDFSGPPGYMFSIDERNSRKLVAYVVEFVANTRLQGILPALPSECYLVDGNGDKHPASEIGAGGSGVDGQRCFAVFPSWPGDAEPIRMEMRVPARTREIQLNIDDMKLLSFTAIHSDGG